MKTYVAFNSTNTPEDLERNINHFADKEYEIVSILPIVNDTKLITVVMARDVSEQEIQRKAEFEEDGY